MQCRKILRFFYDLMPTYHGVSKRFQTYRYCNQYLHNSLKEGTRKGRGRGTRKMMTKQNSQRKCDKIF